MPGLPTAAGASNLVELQRIIRHQLSMLPEATHRANVQGTTDSGRQGKDETLAVLLPIIILLASLLFLLLLSLVILICARKRRGGLIRLSDHTSGPTDLADDEELEQGSGGLEGLESRWLDEVSESTKLGYIRAKGGSYHCLGGAMFVRTVQEYLELTTPFLLVIHSLASSVPTQQSTNRHHSHTVPLNTRKGRLRLVLRSRLRQHLPAFPRHWQNRDQLSC